MPKTIFSFQRITPLEYDILKKLDSPQSIFWLAKLQGVRHQTMNNRINRMELKGLISRDRNEGKQTFISRTRLGRKILNAVQ